MPSANDWIALDEAAAILAASNVHFRPSTIGAWARSGKLQSIKLGGRRFVRRGEIKALVTPARRVRAGDLQPGLFTELDG
ncbi:MAG TPA: helix-turn-helix domain-containing protein [Candidatus Limnocylindrales bacterium]|nr:helix-turn-helix domain-containing protein [Candidatus Limnocylindrales bacterium]